MYILEDNLDFAVGGYINYGHTVQFVNQANGFALPPIRLHRCELTGDKQIYQTSFFARFTYPINLNIILNASTGAKLNTNDPISQLHRIALEIIQPRKLGQFKNPNLQSDGLVQIQLFTAFSLHFMGKYNPA